MAGQISFDIGNMMEILGKEKVPFIVTKSFGHDYKETVTLRTGKGVFYRVYCSRLLIL